MATLLDEIGLPEDVNAERLALGLALFNPNNWPELSAILAVDDFSLQKHRKIYLAMREIFEAGGIPDRPAVAGFLADRRDLEAVGGISYLVDLYEPLEGAFTSLEQVCRRVRDKAVLREFITRFSALSNECLMNGDSRSVIERAETALVDLRKGESGSRKLRSVEEIVASEGGFDSIFSRSKAIAPTPFPKLNLTLGGGFREDELILLAARPGFGKSALAAQIADYCAVEGAATAYFGLEMSNKETLLRMACSRARVDSNTVRHNRHSQRDRTALREAMNVLTSIPIHFDDTASATVGAMHAALRTLRHKGKLSLVVVDYIQLMEATGRFGNRTEQVSAISRGLKLLAKELHCAVLALSQLTRENVRLGERPQLHHLRESGSLEQDANTVIFLHPTVDDMKQPIRPTDAIVAKQRNGPIADVKLEFHKIYTRFEEPTPEPAHAFASRNGTYDNDE